MTQRDSNQSDLISHSVKSVYPSMGNDKGTEKFISRYICVTTRSAYMHRTKYTS